MLGWTQDCNYNGVVKSSFSRSAISRSLPYGAVAPASSWRETLKDRLISNFTDRRGGPPAAVVRSPGRVNLIGEHTDYSLLPVMPVAIDRSVYLAVSPGPAGRLIADSLSLPDPLEVDLAAVPVAATGWHRYLLAAVRVLAPAEGQGARILIGGDLPPTGGLSSSSALTVGVLAALNQVWALGIPRSGYPELAVRAERSIGVEGGAMDQTIISLAREGAALRIDFDPPAHRYVPLPPGLGLVAAYSGTPAPKGGDANHSYNLRVVASRAAALMLGRETGVEVGSPPSLSRVAARAGIETAAAALPVEMSAHRVARLVGAGPETIVSLAAGRFDPDTPLPLRAVAVHVLSESRRVDEAEEALGSDLDRFGRVLDASHRSLQVFGASSGPLDRLVEAMRSAGAYGARLTGAGFGGYAVAAVPVAKVPAVVAAAEAATGGPAFAVEASAGVFSEQSKLASG